MVRQTETGYVIKGAITSYGSIDLGKLPLLKAGCDEVLTFPFVAGGLLRKFIDAGRYSIKFTIEYEKADASGKAGDDSTLMTKVVSKDITVYYHTIYMIFGGILGGILGVIFRDWDTIKSLPPVTTLILDVVFGMLVGLIIVVILKRKSGVQSFVSVNDFLGGILVGFIAGASGKELINGFVNDIVNNNTTYVSVTSTPTPTITTAVTGAVANTI